MIAMKGLLSLALFAVCCSQAGSRNPYGKLIDQWEVTNDTFKVRIIEYEEREPTFLHHYFYVFESVPVNGDGSRRIMMVEMNDDRPIPKDQVRFINSLIAYVYMKSFYAVTVDGGQTWTVWNATEALPNWDKSFLYIQVVEIAPSGMGTLTLLPFSSGQQGPTLHTNDYGQHWTF